MVQSAGQQGSHPVMPIAAGVQLGVRTPQGACLVQSAGQQGARDEGGRHHSSLAASAKRIRQPRGVQSGLQWRAPWVTQGRLPSQCMNCLGRSRSLKLPYQCLTCVLCMYIIKLLSKCLQGYLPGEYESLSSAYGTETDLRQCIKALHAHGIKAVADVVLNHRCAGRQVRHSACRSPCQ